MRVPQLHENADYAQRLEQIVRGVADVKSIRVNRTVGSIVIAYQSGAKSDAEMRSHLANLIRTARLSRATPSQSPGSQAVEAESYESLKQQSEEQTKLIADLQQQIAELQRIARIGEFQLNKWRYRTFFN